MFLRGLCSSFEEKGSPEPKLSNENEFTLFLCFDVKEIELTITDAFFLSDKRLLNEVPCINIKDLIEVGTSSKKGLVISVALKIIE